MNNQLKTTVRRAGRVLAYLVVSLSLTACATAGRTERAAVVDRSAGVVAVSGLMGNQTGSVTRDAIISATVGGTIGGIIDNQMDQQAKELTPQLAGATVERVGQGIRVTFDAELFDPVDSDGLRPDAAKKLQQLARSLDRYRDTDLLIVGHTDSVGSAAHNQDLSERRAQVVVDYLVAQGAKPGRLHAAGRGEMEPRGGWAARSGGQASPRIEVAIYASPSYRSELKGQYGAR